MLKVKEHDIQCSFFNWVDKMSMFDWRYKNIFAVPNGSKLPFKNIVRKGEKIRVCPQAQRLKKEGLRSGVLDVVVAYPIPPYAGMFIEFKTDAGKVSPEQKDWIERLTQAGYHCVVMRSWEDAVNALKKYLKGTAQ